MLGIADIDWQMPHKISLIYPLVMIVAMVVGAIRWNKNNKGDNAMWIIYVSAIGGAFLGAKIIYLLSEGYLIPSDNPHRWQAWITGKSILGGLLGGYLTVEGFKKVFGITKATGDQFAIMVPLGVALGRTGCLAHGCCKGVIIKLGIAWPAPTVEMGFNLLLALILYSLKRKQLQQQQLFHIYLMSYGVFRFFHEFLRATPKQLLGLSGYQWTAFIIVIFAAYAYIKRSKQPIKEIS